MSKLTLFLVLLAAAPLYAEAPPDVAPTAPPAAAPAAPPAPPTVAEVLEVQTSSPVLAYVPDAADLAIFVRVNQLTRSDLWKKFAAPEAGLYKKYFGGLPLAIDLQNDVAAAAIVVELAYEEGQPPGSRHAFILEMNREVRPGDLLRESVAARTVEGVTAPAYPVGTDLLMAVLQPRLLVLATGDYLARIVRLRDGPREAGAKAAGPLPVDALTAPGEIAFAARVSPGLKESISGEYAKMHRRTLVPNAGVDGLIEFSLYYNLCRVVIEAETVTGSVYLPRETDALRAEVRFASKAMAPFTVAVLQAMADPLQMGLPALFGGTPLDEPPPAPFYHAAAEGPAVRITMPRAAIEGLVDAFVTASRTEAGRAASAEHLRTLGAAILTYATDRGKYPATWADLVRAGLVLDAGVFENPALASHLAAGDYELVPLTKEAAAQKPYAKTLAYEVCPKDAPPPALNVLFADGHVEYLESSRFRELYKETLESLGR
jgi:prepilin-type processing-associated H-X9-DG protein